jgi:tetratricopeptide (TPR) repeat protein
MDFLKRVTDWLGVSPPKQKPDIAVIADLIDLGRQARYAENYANALDIFEKATALARSKQDTRALAIAQLNIADTYIQLRRFDEALLLLTELKADTEKRQHTTPLAYTLCILGYLHQMQGDWETARETYNEALTIAQKANATGAIGRAKGHLAETYLRENNATYAEHLLHDALPLLDDTGDVELISHFIGQYALTMLQLGRDVDGDRLLDTALRRAQQLEFISQIRHWQQVLGERKLETHNYKSAFEHYHEFLKLSPDPLPETEEYGLALSNLSEITRQLGQQKEALDYARQAERILSQIDSDTVSSQALTTVGLAMRADGQYDNALNYLEQALTTTQPSSDEALTIRLEIAETFTIAEQYTNAEATYHSLVEQLDETAAPEILARANVGLGKVYKKQYQLDKAIHQWMIAQKLTESATNYNQTARIICDIAQARYESGDGKRAMSDYERALMLLNSVDKETRGIVMTSVANAYADKGDVATTESFFGDAIDIAHDLNNPLVEALRRNDYALYLIDIGQSQRAILSLEHALKLTNELDNSLNHAIFIDHMGLAYRALKNPEKALVQHLLAQEQLSEINAPQRVFRNHLFLVEVYLDLDQVEEASNHIPNLTTDEIDMTIQYQLTTARLNLLQNEIGKADTIISEAITQAEAGYRQRLLAKALVLQSQIQAANNDRDTALETWQSAEKLLKLLQMPIPNPNWLHIPSE